MAIINLSDKKIYFKGTMLDPCFDQLISFDIDAYEIRLQDAFGGEYTTTDELDATRFLSYDPELNTLTKLITYFYSINMNQNLRCVPVELRIELDRKVKEEKFNTLFNILNDINSDKVEVIVKDVEDDDDKNLYDPEDTHKLLNLSGNRYIEDSDYKLNDLCSDVLISTNGSPDYEYIRKLRSNGFNVFPTEVDSFGWLGAAVKTNKGLIFFG